MLKVLERIENGRQERIDLSVRLALVQRGLIEAGSQLRLTITGQQLLAHLRLRSAGEGVPRRQEA